MRFRTGSRALHAKTAKVLLVVSVVLFTLWAGVGVFLYLSPVDTTSTEADALLVLAPTDGRLEYAEQLMDQGYASTLVISVPPPEYLRDDDVPCNEARQYRVLCFEPDPVTTQGEARGLQQLAAANGWTSVNVVTDKSHAPRASILMSRCYPGEISMLPYQKDLPLLSFAYPTNSWAFEYAYETAAFAKVLLKRSC